MMPTPVLSRRDVTPTMAARGMRSAAELAEGKPCGTRLRYYAGCRCDACRRANSIYERERQIARARGETNGIVSAENARAHLAWLSSRGVGRKTAADAAKVAASIVSKVIDGQRTKIRAQTERRILAVTEAAAADRAYIDGEATWCLLDELLADGYSKTRVASEMLGRSVRTLQIAKGKVTARNAALARRAYERLRRCDAGPMLALLQELSDEGFYRDRVLKLLSRLAASQGLAEIYIDVRNGRVQHSTAMLVQQLHRQLTE